jgi:tRNA nucleotidyltransferase (CCA-adding enzyme)
MPENLSLKLEKFLPPPVLALVKIAGTEAAAMGQELYIVGGVVRDLFLRRSNFDFDLVVEGEAISLARKLAGDSGAKLILHERFGTAKLIYPEFSLDLATARSESYSRPGALPLVKAGRLKDDLIRRDFSINAIALHLNPERFGQLIDLYHGQQDIKRRQIRILHPKSFMDDATRILRAIRYEQRLGFRLEPETEKLLRRDVTMLDTISGDRLRHELELILKENEPERALARARELGVMKQLNHLLKVTDKLAQSFTKAREITKSSLPTVYLCLLIYDLTEKENEEFISRLNFPKTLAQAMRQTLQLKKQLTKLDNPRLKPADIHRLLHGYSSTAIQANATVSESPTISRNLILYLDKLRYVKPLLKGKDLINMGVPSGPKIGEILDALLKAKLNGEVRTRKDEEKIVNHLW